MGKKGGLLRIRLPELWQTERENDNVRSDIKGGVNGPQKEDDDHEETRTTKCSRVMEVMVMMTGCSAVGPEGRQHKGQWITYR